jgi:hypothetical protein
MLQTAIPATTENLYDRDYQLWLADTIGKLKAGDFRDLDIAHLVEEIEDLGKRDQRELQSRLIVLFAHLLKRCYVDFAGGK